MTTQFIGTLVYAAAIILGAAVGFAFGKIQIVARQKYIKRQNNGKLNSAAAIVPGSMQRIALFLVALVLIQVGVPMLFQNNVQWLVSAGVVLGYGYTLLQQLRQRTTI